jgi:hypothetical protein
MNLDVFDMHAPFSLSVLFFSAVTHEFIADQLDRHHDDALT